MRPAPSRRRGLAIGAAVVSIAGAAALLLQLRQSVPPSPSTKDEESPVDPEPDAAAPSPGSAPAAPIADPSSPGPSRPAAGEEDLMREIARLNVTDKPRALALAFSADDTSPSTGMYAEARRAMIITLLVDLGWMEEARQRVPAYLEAYPDSRYVPLVEGKTGIHPRPGGPKR